LLYFCTVLPAFLKNIFVFVGKISLELYISHLMLIFVWIGLAQYFGLSTDYYNWILYLLILIPLSVLISLGFNKLYAKLIKK